MAKGGKDEHRMLFDLQGKRRNVVKVVYAILAVLMGLSLLLVIGPAPLADIFGTQDEVSNAAKQYEEQAERIEAKLVKDPEDPALLVNLTRARVNAANQLSEFNETTAEPILTVESRQQLEQASSTWSEYLEATDEPSAALAQSMGAAFFSLAQTSTSRREIESNLDASAQAQKIVAEQRPNVGSLTSYALYALFAFEYAAAKEAIEEAEDLAVSKTQRTEITRQYQAAVKRAKEFEAEQNEVKKAEAEQTRQGGGQGQGGGQLPETGNPLGGALGGGSSLSE